MASGHFFLIQIFILQGRSQDILPEIERVRSDSLRGVLYPIAYNALGRKKESDAALRELIAKLKTTFGLCDLTHLSMRVGLYLHPLVRAVVDVKSR